MSPLTVLLVPPAGDTALLAEECGGRVPTLTLCNADERTPNVPGAWHVASPGCREHPRVRALVLVRDGVRAPLGIFRAWYYADAIIGADPDPGGAEGLSIAMHDDLPAVVEWAASLRRNDAPLGRVVLLRDGREVES